jgi:hypothetical protein
LTFMCRIAKSELLNGFMSILNVSSAITVDALQCLTPSV